jgi:hypothetical protein
MKGRTSLSRRSYPGAPTPFALGAAVIFFCITAATMTSVANATVARARPAPALGGFVKDKVLASVLGETLFRDTLEVMSDSGVASAVAAPVSGAGGSFRDNSAAGQVARAVLAHRSLDKYLWLIRRAYDDALWKGGDRARIEAHFPLIWRTSIMLYESTLEASPHRVHVCAPTGDPDNFDCHDELGRAKIVPIPAAMPLPDHQPNMG